MKPWIRNVQREVAETWDGAPAACISISQPGFPAELPSQLAPVLRLEFADWDLDRYTRETITRHRSNEVFFDEPMAQQIVDFAEKHCGQSILVHCDAGVSRSGAVAEVLLEALPGYEDRGGIRHSNNYVRRLLRRAFGLVPIGAESDSHGV